jgi:hypothetical protein
VTRRWFVAAALMLVAAACNGDDDDDAVESSVPATTAAPETSQPPETTGAPATTSTTVETTTTTLDVEALKAQIAEDYLRSWQLRRELTANPTLDGLDEKLAQISAPESESSTNLRVLIEELVTVGERVELADPTRNRIDVEGVELVGSDPVSEAVVTVCYVRDLVRRSTTGEIVSESGLLASRSREHVVRTPNGWLPDTGFEDVWEGLEVTECPPA